MRRKRTYNIFISHSWKYSDSYFKLENLLRKAPGFKWKNYSISKRNPLAGGSKKKLAAEIERHIRLASIVLVISGMYVSYSEWIEFEIDLADRYEKPILGIFPRGNFNLPYAVSRSATEVVNWNTNSIVDAVGRNAI